MLPIDNNNSTNNFIYNAMSTNISQLSTQILMNNASEYFGLATTNSELKSALDDNQMHASNVSSGLSKLQTVTSSVDKITSNIDRMKTLATQAASGTYSTEEVAGMQTEFDTLVDEIDAIAIATQPGGKFMLLNNGGEMNVSIATGLTIDIETKAMTVTSLGITNNIDLTNNPNAVLTGLNNAADEISTYYTHLTEKTSALVSSAIALDTQKQSLMATKSVVTSIDAAIKMVALIDSTSAAQTGLLLIAQANTTTNTTLQLLAD